MSSQIVNEVGVSNPFSSVLGFRYLDQDEIDLRMKIREAFEVVSRGNMSRAIELPLAAPVADFVGRAPRPLSERNVRRLFSAITPEGTPCALRYEGTALTAKYVAAELNIDPSIQLRRYHYFQEMVRVELAEDLDEHHYRAFYQAGAEFFAKGVDEHNQNIRAIIGLTIDFLHLLKLNPILRISHVDILKVPLLQVAGLSNFNSKRIMEKFESGTIEELTEILKALRTPQLIFDALITLFANKEVDLETGLSILQQFGGLFSRASKDLQDLLDGLKQSSLDKFCRFDPGVNRSLDFYSGLTFQGDVSQLKECLGGGVFSGLVESFGRD